MLIDTSGFLCKHDKGEICHKDAVGLYDSATSRLTSNYVLAEYTALAQVRGISRGDILKFSEGILDDGNIEIVWVDKPLHRMAIDLLKERLDKSYSLCDAVSFVIMRERGIAEALTTDRHFEQEGFVRLLRP